MGLQVVDIAAAAVAAIENQAGLQCRWVTGGGSGTYKLEAGSGVFNEVQPGDPSAQCLAKDFPRTAVLSTTAPNLLLDPGADQVVTNGAGHLLCHAAV